MEDHDKPDDGKKKIETALISIYHKTEQSDAFTKRLHELEVSLISTGGTYDHIKALGLPVTSVEEITKYPSMLGGD